MTDMIHIEHLSKSYKNGSTPLKDVCLDVKGGQVVSIIGASGCGKSTLLRCMNGLEEASSGRIVIDGTELTRDSRTLRQIREKTGMVFQSFHLFSHKLIAENVMMAPVDILRLNRQEAYDRAMKMLDRVGLRDYALKYPDELSGGQQQRVAIARALAMNPKIILFDEPTSALDPTMVGEVLHVIADLRNQGLTMLIVTHEMEFARKISDKIVFLAEGIVYEEGSPEEIFTCPKKPLTREFIHGRDWSV